MLAPFQCLSPEWSVPGVKACTILATLEDGAPAAESYPVSLEMRVHFLKSNPDWSFVFEEGSPGQYNMDLQKIAWLQLVRSGITPEHLSGAHWDTFTNPLQHSARWDGEHSGRMATVVWME